MSKKKWSVDNVEDACSCQTQKVWMWQSITNTIIPCNTWKSRSDVLVKDKLSLVLQHPFPFGWVQPPLENMRNQEWSPDKWFLLLKRGAKTSAVLFLSCKASSGVLGPLNLWNGMCLQEWICTPMDFSPIPDTVAVQDLVGWRDRIFPGSELSCWWEAKYLSLNLRQFLNSVIIPRICGIWNTDIW